MLQLLSGRRKVIQSGTLAYTFGGLGVVSVPVAIAGVSNVSRVVERLLGYTFNANEYYDVAIQLVSPTQLMVHMRANSAGTITVDWDVVASDGVVQRGYVSMTTAVAATANISPVDVSRAKAHNNGIYLVSPGVNLGGYKTNSRVKVIDPVTVQINRSAVNTNNESRLYYAVEA